MNETAEISLSAEFIRKGIHLFALVIPVGYYLIPFPVTIICVSVSAVISIIIDFSRFNSWKLWHYVAFLLRPIIREHETKGGFTGASYILTTSAICIAIFPKVIAIAAITFIIVGDSAAALVGRKWGRHKIIGKKTVEGSSACLISLVLVSFVLPGLPTAAALPGAVAATLAETFSGKIDDNLAVPIISGFVMLMIMSSLGYEQAVFLAPFR
jgi:dolichol kinase